MISLFNIRAVLVFLLIFFSAKSEANSVPNMQYLGCEWKVPSGWQYVKGSVNKIFYPVKESDNKGVFLAETAVIFFSEWLFDEKRLLAYNEQKLLEKATYVNGNFSYRLFNFSNRGIPSSSVIIITRSDYKGYFLLSATYESEFEQFISNCVVKNYGGELPIIGRKSEELFWQELLKK